MYPQSLFWGEEQVQELVDRGHSLLPRTIVPGAMFISVPFNTVNILGIGLTKLVALAICVCTGWPGGVLFPLYYAGLAFGMVLSDLVYFVKPTLAMFCMMASMEVAILRTPWATMVILLILQAPIVSCPNSILAVAPLMLISCYTTLFLTRKYHYYPHSMQRSRDDTVPPETILQASSTLVEPDSLIRYSSMAEENIVDEYYPSADVHTLENYRNQARSRDKEAGNKLSLINTDL